MNELKLKKMVNAVAYFAVIFLAVALVLSQISSGSTSLFGSIANIFERLANVIAYLIVAVMAFFYVKTKRNIIYMVTYVVSVILIVIFVIIPIF